MRRIAHVCGRCRQGKYALNNCAGIIAPRIIGFISSARCNDFVSFFSLGSRGMSDIVRERGTCFTRHSRLRIISPGRILLAVARKGFRRMGHVFSTVNGGMATLRQREVNRIVLSIGTNR